MEQQREDSLSLADALRQATPARIAIGRSGGSLTTAEVLRFQRDHAAARDAVCAPLDIDTLAAGLSTIGPTLVADSAASGLAEFLQRPDQGRKLDAASRDRLMAYSAQQGPIDVCLIVSAGLSPIATQRHATAVATALARRLSKRRLVLGPIVVVYYGRVALQDEIGELLRARVAVTLLGERPGLASPDSLGAYLVYQPRLGRTDAERNCVSNIHAAGLSYEAAAETITYLVTESLRRGLSGVELKDDRSASALATDSTAQLPSLTADNAPRVSGRKSL